MEITDLFGILTDLNQTQAAANPITITAAGETVLTTDFGYAPSGGSGTIGGTVWHDQNQVSAVGVLDVGEVRYRGHHGVMGPFANAERHLRNSVAASSNEHFPGSELGR